MRNLSAIIKRGIKRLFSFSFKKKKRFGRTHTTIVSLLKRNDGYCYSMLINFLDNSFYVIRAATESPERISTGYYDFNYFDEAEKELIFRYDRFEGDEEDDKKFDEMLVSTFNQHLEQQGK